MGFARFDAADAACLLVGAALALLTAPALALLHGDSARRKNIVVGLVRALWAIPIVAVQWVLCGYSLAFGPNRHGLLGGLAYAVGGGAGHGSNGREGWALIAFRMTFALATPAAIAGAFADRMKFRAYVAFVLCWSTLVFVPMAHGVWDRAGWLGKLGVLDFAGGTVVQLATGISLLVCIAMMGRRPADESGSGAAESRDGLVKGLAAALLWVAYVAINTAGALPSAKIASLSFITTQLAAAAGALGWVVVEWRDFGKMRPVGVASGIVAGLVAISPAAGYVSPSAAIAIGFIGGAVSYGTALGAVAGLSAALLAITADAGYVAPATAVALAAVAGGICYGAVLLRERFGASRVHDTIGTHAAAGLAGVLLTGVFAQKALNDRGADGALFGNSQQAAIQCLACVAAAAYAALGTFVILKVIDAVIGLRSNEEPRVDQDVLERCDVTGVRQRRPSAARARGAASR